MQQRVVVFGELGHGALGLRLDVDHVEQQQRVVRGERAPRLADDVRHRQLVLAARLGERVDDVVRVLLQRVVHARVATSSSSRRSRRRARRRRRRA